MLQVKNNYKLCFVISLSFLLFACSNREKVNEEKVITKKQCDDSFNAHFVCYFGIKDFKSGKFVKYKAGTNFKTILETKEVAIALKSFKAKYTDGDTDSTEFWIVQFADRIDSRFDYEIIFQNKEIYKSNKYSKIKYGEIEAGYGYDCVLLSYLHNGKDEIEKTYFFLK
jgi:hypothetical protein